MYSSPTAGRAARRRHPRPTRRAAGGPSETRPGPARRGPARGPSAGRAPTAGRRPDRLERRAAQLAAPPRRVAGAGQGLDRASRAAGRLTAAAPSRAAPISSAASACAAGGEGDESGVVAGERRARRGVQPLGGRSQFVAAGARGLVVPAQPGQQVCASSEDGQREHRDAAGEPRPRGRRCAARRRGHPRRPARTRSVQPA